MERNPSSSKADRKTIEKNRRNQMKTLFSQLSSLVPHHSRVVSEVLSLPDQIGEATEYIKNMQIQLEKMKEKRDSLMMEQRLNNNSRMGNLRVPRVDIQEMRSSALQVVLITGSDCQFLFTEAIRLLHEEGAEVLNASFSVVDNTIFHTLHSKIGESAPSHAAARISERLKKCVYGEKYQLE